MTGGAYSEAICKTCGVYFRGMRSGQAPRQFCSLKCAYEGRRSHVESMKKALAETTRTCARCGDTFTPTGSNQKYCPSGCKWKVDNQRRSARRMDDLIVCAHCSRSYARAEGLRKYCSLECQQKEHKERGTHGNRDRVQTPEHIAKRVAATKAKLASMVRQCVRCGRSYTPTTAAQKYCSGQCWNAVAATRRPKAARPRIGKAEYERRLAEQGGVCGICRRPPEDGRRLAGDHDHATDLDRGLLCGPCNTAIGLFRDDPVILQAAIDYLGKYNRTI